MKKIVIITLLALACGFAARAAVTEQKVVNYRFDNESAASKLHVNSVYGNVTVTQGDQSYIDVRVEIKATAKDQDAAQKLLDRINILFSGKGASCSAKTEIRSANTGGRKESFEINYKVTIPKGSQFDIYNKYGNTIVGNLDGTFTADIQYGNINASELNGKANVIDIQYGNINMGNSPELRLSMAYSNIKASNIASLRIDSKYSNGTLGYVGNMQLSNSSYDNYNLDKVHTLKSSSGTSGISIGTLIKSADLPSVKYGHVTIDNVEAGFESINITASYSNVRINFTNPSFSYILKAKYGDASLGKIPHDNKKELRGYTEVTLEGTAGSNSNAKVNITANYGSINLDKK